MESERKDDYAIQGPTVLKANSRACSCPSPICAEGPEHHLHALADCEACGSGPCSADRATSALFIGQSPIVRPPADPEEQLLEVINRARAAHDGMAARRRASRPSPVPALPAAGEDVRIGWAERHVEDLLERLGAGDVIGAREAAERVVAALGP